MWCLSVPALLAPVWANSIWSSGPKTIPEKQAVAAVGQGILLHIYEKMFSEYGQATAQLLLTKADLEHRQRFLNGRNTLLTLLKFGVIPIVNENDTVAFEKLNLADNDTLAALVGTLIDADLILLLTDIDGFYDGDPRKNKNAKRISVVETINEEIEGLAGNVGSKFGSGGMITKITAGPHCGKRRYSAVIGHGARPTTADLTSRRTCGHVVFAGRNEASFAEKLDRLWFSCGWKDYH